MIGGCADGSLHRCAGGGVALHGCPASFSITELWAGTAALLKRAGCPLHCGPAGAGPLLRQPGMDEAPPIRLGAGSDPLPGSGFSIRTGDPTERAWPT